MGLRFRPGVHLYAAAMVLSAFASAQTSPATDEASAFQQARAQIAPETRLTALTAYLDRFPTGAHHDIAEDLLLNTYLNAFPDHTAPIHTLAAALIAAAPAGFERWSEEATLANLLAAAKPQGADLADAQTWAQAALDALTEPAYRRETSAAHRRYKLPKLTPRQIHDQFLAYRATFLSAGAHVALDQHRTPRAAQLLTEAAHLNAFDPEVNLLEAQLALTQNQSQLALNFFERADALGALDPDARQQELQLFQTLNPPAPNPPNAPTAPNNPNNPNNPNPQVADALDRQVDAIYRTLYPPLYTLPTRQLPPGGHTTLLELFTGSGCQPCAGPDLALESLLATYTRQDLAVLEFDEHIPRPDPLTTPDSVQRAAFYNAETTPEAFLDGQPLQILGSSRPDVENIVLGFADAIETQATLPSGLHLTANLTQTPTGNLQAAITLNVVPTPSFPPDETTGATSLRSLARAQLFAALVQDNLRYSGENGIRFHRMVVRALQQSPAATFLTPTPHPLTFHPAAIQQANTAYLTDFQSTNDRFGAFRFPTTTFPLDNAPLALVVWVQDPTTQQILQTTFTSLPKN